MKLNPLTLALSNYFIAFAVHIYGTINYFKFLLVTGHKSSCNLNETFNCDVISASQYSTFFGVPLALWGAATCFVILMLLLGVAVNTVSDRNKFLRWSLALATFIAFMSIIMGTISTVILGSYCLSCVLSYVLSFLGFEFVRRSQEEPALPNIISDLKSLASNWKFILGMTLSVPVLAFVSNVVILSSYNATNLVKMTDRVIREWKASPVEDFSTKPGLVSGPTSSSFEIVEFADFLCGHCQKASVSLSAFKKSHPDVHFKFYVFPLDGTCNPVIKRQGNGVPCLLAQAVLCGESQGIGWQLHDIIFENQTSVARKSYSKVKGDLKDWTEAFQGDWGELETCMDSEETRKSIALHSEIGEKAGVLGTPTVFVNGKKLKNGQSLPIMNRAYQESQQKK